MRKFYQAAILAFGVGGALAAVPASAQPYGPNYGRENYSDYYQQNDPAYDQAYGDPAYGAPGYDQGYGDPAYAPPYGDPYADSYGCDPQYGCPQDYADLPLYDGEVYYDGAWLNGPLYYRDFGGSRQFWIHGGWHGGNTRGGHFGAPRGYRGGFAANRGYRGYSSGYRGNVAGRSFYRPDYHAQQQQAVRQFSRPNGFGARQSFQHQSFQGGGHGGRGGNHGGGGGHNWSGGGHHH